MPSPSLPVLPNSLGQKRLVSSPHPLSNFSASPSGLIGSLQIGGIVTGKHDCDALSYNFNITEAACLYLRMGGPGLRAIGSLPTHFLSVLQNPPSISLNLNITFQSGSFYRNSGVMLQTLIPSGAFIAGFCIRGEQELIACSKGNSPIVCKCAILPVAHCTVLFSEFGEFLQRAKAGMGA